MKLIANLLRKRLRAHGYVLWKYEYLRFGISPILDISRLNRAWGRSIDVVFDVGANAGQFAKDALQEAPKATIHSFEPHPATFSRLQETISGNPRVFCHQIALGNKVGNVDLHEYGSEGDGSLLNSLVPNARFPTKFGYSAKKIPIQCTTLDAFSEAHRIDHISLLKIDTEGFDLCVLEGSKSMLEQQRIDYVYVEFNGIRPVDGISGGALLPISDYLSSYGLDYVTTYTDFVLNQGQLAVCANALFARAGSPDTERDPHHDAQSKRSGAY